MRAPKWLLRAERAPCALVLGLPLAPAAQVHPLVAQRGTLDIVRDGFFMVLSLPVCFRQGARRGRSCQAPG